jgi:phage-related minor tail protein
MIKCWLDAGWYSHTELQRAVVELKEAHKEADKNHAQQIKKTMVEAKEHIKKESEK